MVTEERFGRLEDKVDKIKDDVHETKHNNAALCTIIELHMEKIEAHITGDEKIISEIQPLLAELPSIIAIVKDYEVDKEIAVRAKEDKAVKFSKYKNIGAKLAILGTTVGIITSIYRTFF